MAVDASAPASDGTLSAPGEAADDLTALNEPDLMMNEQTWPTEEDMEGVEDDEEAGTDGRGTRGPGDAGEDEAERKARLAKIAKMKRKRGAEGHQASWLIYALDDEGEGGGGEGEDDDGDVDLDAEEDAALRAADGFGAEGAVDMADESETGKEDGHEELEDEEEERQ